MARLPLCEEHVCKMERRTNQMGVNATEHALTLQKEKQQLKDMVRASIQQLVQYIFPIIPVQPVPRLEHLLVIIPVQLLPRLEHMFSVLPHLA
jgi:hypothetical protein